MARHKSQTNRIDQLPVVNLELGGPSVESALLILEEEIDRFRFQGTSAIKIIHGYGSTGKGGAIREAARHWLDTHRYKYKTMIFGENFDMFNQSVLHLIQTNERLRFDRDYGSQNRGITILVLK